MAKFKLLLEYDGTKFSGWQMQRNEITVQGKLAEACIAVFQTKDFEIYGSGRTDAGVHALEQCAHLEVKTMLAPEIIKMKLNDELPAAVNILSIRKADTNFHARHDAVSRSYIYHISTRRTAFGKKYCWWIKDKLDIAKMKRAAACFEGMKDFKSFGQKDNSDKSTKVLVNFCRVIEKDDSVFIHINGSHFLWKMVRRITGIIAEAGRGKLDIREIEEMFRNISDKPAKLTAPPSGLYLEKVYYKGEKITDEFRINLIINKIN